MSVYYADATTTVHHGDCLDVLRALPDASVDAVVTDPPAAIAFMGKAWDGDRGGREPWIAWLAEVMRGCLRVAKPGAHAVVWGLPRTSHWTACGIEDAGWEIRDRVSHLTGQGFPKSRDVSKAIDAEAGAEREVVGKYVHPGRGAAWAEFPSVGQRGTRDGDTFQGTTDHQEVNAPATDAARQWDGWGTALKPAAEDWWIARKPLAAGTVAGNVLAHGTGALNIDATRVPGQARPFGNGTSRTAGIMGQSAPRGDWESSSDGRWPSNVVLSHAGYALPDGTEVDLCADRCAPGCPVAELDAQSGDSASAPRLATGRDTRGIPNGNTPVTRFHDSVDRGHDDAGGASRFFPTFRYEAKADTAERPRHGGVAHNTVKPLDLMRWLVRLVTPRGGTVLDMFAGSGTTGEACQAEGFACILGEREPEYLPLIVQRLTKRSDPVRHLADKGEDLGLFGLLDGQGPLLDELGA